MIPSLFGLKGMAIAGGISLIIGIGIGWKGRDALCDAAAARLQVASLKADLKAAHDQLARSHKIAAELNDARAENEEKVHELEQRLASLPAGDVCRLSDDDVRGLLNIK